MRAFLADSQDHDAALALLRDPSHRLVSSELLCLEADRAAIRLANEFPALRSLPTEVSVALRGVSVIALDRTVLNAARVIPDVVKSLDAIHIATAELLGDDIECVVTYDNAMAIVLRAHGVASCTAKEVMRASDHSG